MGASLPDSNWSPVIVLDVPCVPIQVVEGWRPRSVWIWCQRKVDIFQGVLCPTQGNCSLRSRSFSIPIDVSWPIDGNMLSQYFTHTHADDLAQRFFTGSLRCISILCHVSWHNHYFLVSTYLSVPLFFTKLHILPHEFPMMFWYNILRSSNWLCLMGPLSQNALRFLRPKKRWLRWGVSDR